MSTTASPTRNPAALRILPVDDDRDTGGFFRAAQERRLVVKACDGCGTPLHLPRAHCSHCGSWDTSWHEVGGAATLYAWTVVVRPFHAAYPVPYTVVLVDLDEAPGVRLVGYVDGRPELRAGQPMELWWDEVEAGDGPPVVLPNWRPSLA
jgi:uncharacterized OB-fold protein